MSSQIKSPLKYPGAKSRAIPQIAPLIPNFKEYREPFIGGGSVYLYVRQTCPDRKYWINDLYYPLYNFWINTQQNVDKMIERLIRYKNSYRNGHDMQQSLRINSHKFDDIEKASAYYARNRVSFAGLPRGCDENSFKTFTEDKIKGLRGVSELLKGVNITNLDYSKLVEAEPEDGVDDDDIFIFEDPPYYNIKWPELYGKGSRLGNTHLNFDHTRFAKTMKECKYKFLITYDDSNTVRRLFEWANVMPYELSYSMTKYERTGKELFISNYELPKDRQLSIEDAWD